MDNNDLLSSVLDECGLDFADLTAQVTPEQPRLQMLQNFAIPTDIKPPYQSLIENPSFINGSGKILYSNTTLPNIIKNNNVKIKQEFITPNMIVNKNLPGQFVSVVPSTVAPNSKINHSLPESLTPENEQLDEEEDDFATADTFADYMPSKLRIGIRHPDPVVETSSLSSVLPPDVWYRLHIPEEVIDEGRLSALQLEAIVYACQQHENYLSDGSRAGFLIGDGAGVGKGRTIAGVIYENFLQGRKRSIWLSVSTDLKYDAERDLFDIGASKIEVHLLNKFKYGCKIHSPENDNVKRGVIFATYSSLISESTTNSGKYGSRFKQLVQWCGEDFEGVIVFDECHKAKNLFPSSGSGKPTKTGLAVLELQNKLPRARIVYASATGATEPKNMGYMTRLGIWGKGTPFEDFGQFVNAVEKRGVGAMELVAIDLKMRGMYMARQLSFSGVNFRIEEVPLQKDFIKIYNKCTQLWVEAKYKFEKALELMGSDNTLKKTTWTQFWASHQRFFKYLCIASKVKHAVELAKEALRDSKCIVIGLQSTGEARTLEMLEECGGELSDFVSTAKAVFQSLIDKHFPAANRKKLLRLLGKDTSFFDELGITLKRNSKDEIVAVTDSSKQSTSDNKKGTRKARIGALSKLTSDKKRKYSDSDDSDSNSSNSNSESDFEPSENEDDESDFDISDFSESDDNDDDSNDNFSDDDESKKSKKRKKSNFSKIFLNSGKKTKKKSKKIKKQKSQSIRDEIEELNADVMSEEAAEICSKMRDELLDQLEKIGDKLPPNTLDELIDELGGPENVAEMTGRRGRVVSNDNGKVYETRSENDVSLEMLNLVEKQRFMNDEKRVAIISEAASSGISLHSDKRAKNKWRRVHITVELPWSADRAIQQFGRTHRSNQTNAPEYVFLISDLAGEKRFASIVAKRLESLGALTHGDRRATESRDLSRFNIDNKYGRMALEIVMKSIVGVEVPLVKPPDSYQGDFFNDCLEGLLGVGLIHCDRKPKEYQDSSKSYYLDKDYTHITKFLNRLLGLEVEIQNSLFKYFSDTMEAVIRQAKRAGRYDSGIIDLSSEFGKVKTISNESFIMKSSTGAIKIQLHTVSIDRGMSWEEAYNLWSQCKTPIEGFYVIKSNQTTRNNVFLAIADTTNRNQIKHIFRIYKPNSGLQSKYETVSSLKEKGHKVMPDEIEKQWKDIYDMSKNQCVHLLWYGNCRRNGCEIGLRNRTYCILSGAVLTIWPELEKKVYYLQNHRLQIVRLKTNDGLKVIGPMVPPSYVDAVKLTLLEIERGRNN